MHAVHGRLRFHPVWLKLWSLRCPYYFVMHTAKRSKMRCLLQMPDGTFCGEVFSAHSTTSRQFIAVARIHFQLNYVPVAFIYHQFAAAKAMQSESPQPSAPSSSIRSVFSVSSSVTRPIWQVVGTHSDACVHLNIAWSNGAVRHIRRIHSSTH